MGSPMPIRARCPQCGAVLSPPGAACGYCGSAGAAPIARLSAENVVALLAPHVGGSPGAHLHPQIAERVLEGVRARHGAELADDETVLAAHEGGDGHGDHWAVTSRRLCFTWRDAPPSYVAWSDVMPEVFADRDEVCVGRIRLLARRGAADAWADGLAALAHAAHANAPARAGDGWGGPERAVKVAAAPATIPGGRPPNERRPEKESFDRPPYEGWQGVSHVDTHPSGELVAASSGRKIVLRYAVNGARYHDFRAYDSVCSMRFSPDGRWLLVGDLSGRATLYDPRTGQPTGATPHMGEAVQAVAWLGDARFAMGSTTGQVWIVDAERMRVTTRLLDADRGHRQLGDLAATVDGARLFVSIEGRVGAFEAASGRPTWWLAGRKHDALTLAVAPDGATLIAASGEGVTIIDAATGQPRAHAGFAAPFNVCWPDTFEDEDEHGRPITVTEETRASWQTAPRFSPAGDMAAMQDAVGNLVVLDLTRPALHSLPRERGRAWIEDLAWFADGRHLLLGMSDDQLAVWSMNPLKGVMLAPGFRD